MRSGQFARPLRRSVTLCSTRSDGGVPQSLRSTFCASVFFGSWGLFERFSFAAMSCSSSISLGYPFSPPCESSFQTYLLYNFDFSGKKSPVLTGSDPWFLRSSPPGFSHSFEAILPSYKMKSNKFLLDLSILYNISNNYHYYFCR